MNATVLNHTTVQAWVRFDTFNCPEALGPLNASVGFTVNGTTLSSPFTQVATVEKGAVLVDNSSGLAEISHDVTGFSIQALDFNPRDPAENSLQLFSEGTSRVEGRVVGITDVGSFHRGIPGTLACEFTYVEPFTGTLEAAVSSCAGSSSSSSSSSSSFIAVANVVPGTWSVVNQSAADLVFTSAASISINGSGFSSNLGDTTVTLVDCAGATPATLTPSLPVIISANPVFSSGAELQIDFDSLMPSHNGTRLCLRLELAEARRPFVLSSPVLFADAGTVQMSAPFFQVINDTARLLYDTNATESLTLQGRGFQETNSTEVITSTLLLKPAATGDLVNITTAATATYVRACVAEGAGRGLCVLEGFS